MKRQPLLIAAIVLAAALSLLALRRDRTLTLTGIVATDDVIVSAEIPGRLERLDVKEGDAVKAGQLLGTIQAAEWRADLEFYEQSGQQAEAVVAQAKADLQYQEELTESQIRQAGANLASAQAQAVAAAADAENARLDYARAQQLRLTGSNSQQEYDRARTASNGAAARLESLRKQAAAAQAAEDLAKADLHQVAARRAALESDTRGLAAAGAQTDKARVRLAYTEIRAPIDGIVDVRAARQGEVVAAGQPIVTLVNPDDLWVRADVEETYIDQIRLGEQMTVRLPSGAETTGTVFYRSVDADYATQRDVSRTKRDIKTFEIRLRCDNRDRRLALGMTAYVSLTLPRP